MLKNNSQAARPSQAAKPSQAARPLFATLGAFALTLTTVNLSHAQSGPLEDLSTFQRTTVSVLNGKSTKGAHEFNVWIANTPARQAQGFMFIQDLPAGQGMLFPQLKPQKMNMWMKDVFVELDIVFVNEKGAIEQIVEHAKPLNLDAIISNKPVMSVLEIKGGQAASLGLKVGDRVTWAAPDGCECTPVAPPKPKTTS
jgi:uncharacterized membrane protein (UPF0127 family)